MQPDKKNNRGNRKDEPIVRTAVSAKDNAVGILALMQETDNPGALVKKLAPHDYLLAWNEADDEQRADLFRLADKGQAALLIDLRCWTNEEPDIARVEETVKPLVLSGIGGAIHVLNTLEPEIKTLLLKSNVRIHLQEDSNEPVVVPDESELIVCPGGRYHIEFPDPDLVSDVERSLWSALFFKPFEEYQPEIECVIHDFPSELQETALRWRTGRLADYGFLPYEEAMSVLVPRSVGEVRRLAAKASSYHEMQSEMTLPVLYEENLSGNVFLDRVIGLLRSSADPAAQDRAALLGAELAAMTNLYLTATREDISDVDAVARGSRWVRDILALGLFETVDGDVEQGVRFLRALVPAVFLQVGLGRIYPLRDRARALLKDPRFAAAGQAGAVFDPPYFIGLTCMAGDIPSRWPALSGEAGRSISLFEPTPEELAPFSCPDDVSEAERLLSEAEIMGKLLFKALKFKELPIRETPASIVVLTALVNGAADRELEAKPVTFAEARVFGQQVLSIQKDQFLRDAMMVLAPLMGVDPVLPDGLQTEPDPAKRLLIRLIQIGRTRLGADAAERVLLVEDV
ncbi:MAG: hypothetical protein GY762_09295 [Proteobacteria bacterium]|nr:hypothetical protein [Pseudomonadota bacterium]